MNSFLASSWFSFPYSSINFNFECIASASCGPLKAKTAQCLGYTSVHVLPKDEYVSIRCGPSYSFQRIIYEMEEINRHRRRNISNTIIMKLYIDSNQNNSNIQGLNRQIFNTEAPKLTSNGYAAWNMRCFNIYI